MRWSRNRKMVQTRIEIKQGKSIRTYTKRMAIHILEILGSLYCVIQRKSTALLSRKNTK